MTTTKQGNAFINDQKKLKGRWKLTVKLANPLGESGFAGHLLGEYPDPFTGKTRRLVNTNLQPLLGYQINYPITIFNPDENRQDYLNVNFLLGHPKVGVEGIDLINLVKANKESNPTYILTNLDEQNMEEDENQDIIDQVLGRLSLNNKIKLHELRALLATLDLNYIDRRYITNPNTEKNKLRSIVKNYARVSVENAIKVKEILNDMENATYIFNIKELIRHGLMVVSYGNYKYDGKVVGMDLESVVATFKSVPDVWNEITKKVSVLLDNEIKKQKEKESINDELSIIEQKQNNDDD